MAAAQKVTDALFEHAHDCVNTLAAITHDMDTLLTGARRYAENFVYASDAVLEASRAALHKPV
ncbi:hypothetical protein [Streptomyces sp. NBC_01361]|uniref:hypothetical protein n=1 Tax=Streptomyces sp. NBC_01361 TaxID=2903838 RepID=UPI002E347821|nr:hypothetical protein [Streptomyces sp. NBC_01361]